MARLGHFSIQEGPIGALITRAPGAPSGECMERRAAAITRCAQLCVQVRGLHLLNGTERGGGTTHTGTRLQPLSLAYTFNRSGTLTNIPANAQTKRPGFLVVSAGAGGSFDLGPLRRGQSGEGRWESGGKVKNTQTVEGKNEPRRAHMEACDRPVCQDAPSCFLGFEIFLPVCGGTPVGAEQLGKAKLFPSDSSLSPVQSPVKRDKAPVLVCWSNMATNLSHSNITPTSLSLEGHMGPTARSHVMVCLTPHAFSIKTTGSLLPQSELHVFTKETDRKKLNPARTMEMQEHSS
ncbi:unnamed protein product [Pleuronectes platessa]|uniref:Uncharacterized protein n=1 Tax=Pleuronectes platessa TaxID=8262 RepID=A0A9N7YZD7_PLEPL|nr:unnamed protein product [Pleuronectes platessa]